MRDSDLCQTGTWKCSDARAVCAVRLKRKTLDERLLAISEMSRSGLV